MKKVLSFVLVLAMILGSVSMAFGLAYGGPTPLAYGDKYVATPFEDAPNSKLATVLRDLNVLVGNDNKVFLDKTISRAEICAILMRVLGYEDYCTADYAINAVSSFSDVASGYWANGYINLAAQLGYVDGVGNKKFNPTGEVTIEQGIAFVMKALGYSAEHLSLEWPYNFLVPAEAEGLLKGVEKTTGPITREQMFTILYNAMNKPIVAWQANLTNVVLNNNDKVGSWEPVKVDGVTQTFAVKAGSGKNTKSYATMPAIICPEIIAAAYAGNKLDLSAYNGQYVSLVVISKAGVQTILNVEKVLSTEITGEYDENTAGTVASFGAAKLATKAAAVLPHAWFSVNGEHLHVRDGYAKLADMADFEVVEDSVDSTLNALLNAKGEIATLASIQLWIPTLSKQVDATAAALFANEYDATKAAVAKYMSASGLAFVTTDAGTKAKTDDKILGLELLGVDSLDEIKEDDVVTFYTNSTGYIARIEVCRDVVEGTVSRTKTVGSKTSYYINGTGYKLDSTGVGIYEANPASKFALYLDAQGVVVAMVNLDMPTFVPQPWSVGIVTTATAVSRSYVEDGFVVPRVYATVSIVPLGTSAATKFDAVSYGALKDFLFDGTESAPVVAEAFDFDSVKEEGLVVEYKLGADGKVATMRALADSDYEVVDATANEVGVYGLSADGKLFAAGAEAYVITESAAGAKVTLKPVASLAGITYDEIHYHLNKAGKIDAIFCLGNSTEPVVENIITLAAVSAVGKDNATKLNYVAMFADGKSDEKYSVAANVVAGKLYQFKLEDGIIVGTQAAAGLLNDYASKGAVDGDMISLGFEDDVLYITSTLSAVEVTEEVACVKPVIYAFASNTFKVIATTDFEDVADQYGFVEYIDIEGDGFYDVIVVSAVAPTDNTFVDM